MDHAQRERQSESGSNNVKDDHPRSVSRRIAQSHTALLSVIDEGATVFSPDELTRLVYLIIEINAWNRLAITLGTPEPGYNPEES